MHWLPKCWISPALLSSGFRQVFVLNYILPSSCYIFCVRNTQVKSWTGVNLFDWVNSACWVAIFQEWRLSCITPRANKIHGRAAQLCDNTVTRCASCRSMCWKQLWYMSWWDLPSAKGQWRWELQLEPLPEYSFRGLLHPPSVLLYFPVLSPSTECPDTLYWYVFCGILWFWSRMCLVCWGKEIAVSSVVLFEWGGVFYRWYPTITTTLRNVLKVQQQSI